MTSELKSESYARLTFSPEDARVQFDKQFTKNCSVEFVNMLSGLVKACGRYDHVTPKYLGSGKNLVFYYLHKDNDSKVKEEFNLLQIKVSGYVVDTRFLQHRCTRPHLNLDKALWVNHWNGLGRITGCGSLILSPTGKVADQYAFRTKDDYAPCLSKLLGVNGVHTDDVAAHLSETATKIMEAMLKMTPRGSRFTCDLEDPIHDQNTRMSEDFSEPRL